MKLYQVPRDSRIRMEDGSEFNFGNVDGMYSYCTDDAGNVVHIFAGADVEVVSEQEEA